MGEKRVSSTDPICLSTVDYSQYPYSAPITNYLNEPLTLTERVAGGLPPDPHRERLEAHLKDLGETIKGSKKPHRSKKPRETSSRGR